MKNILMFNEKDAQNILFSGGKGANLAKMTSAKFPVPQGFIVTSQAYINFISQAKLLQKFINNFDYKKPKKLNEQTLKLKEYLYTLDLPKQLKNEIKNTLKFFKNVKAFSVRSSSTMEDLAGAAFAGQHDTFLNCVGEKEIILKIKECFISLWHDRAVAYRHKQGFNQQSVTMAVVVQTMVQADCAGVSFSINPINGNMKEILINANYGLGESVVSGESSVDQFIVSKETSDILEKNIGLKTEKIVSSIEGTKIVILDKNVSNKSCISDKQIKEVAKLNLEVERHYCFPQDIEWAYQNNKLFLLQARPITTLPPCWTRDESAERYPNVITPFTWDFVEKAFHISLNYSFNLMGLPPFDGKWFAMFNNYIYGNQNAVWLYIGQNSVSIKNLDDLRKKINFLKDKFSYATDLNKIWRQNLDKYLIDIGYLLSEDLTNKNINEVWKYLLKVADIGTNYFKPNIAISITQALLYKMFMNLISLVVGQEKAKQLFPLLVATTDTKTNNVNTQLYNLSQLIKKDEQLFTIFKKYDSKTIIKNNLLSKFPLFQTEFNNFLTIHGHRETDFDYYIPTWIETPFVVLDNIKLIVNNNSIKSPTEKEEDIKILNIKSQEELFSKVPQDLKIFFYDLLSLVKTYTSLDDLEHYQTTRLTLPIRKGTKVMGTLLKKLGIVKDPYDIFFCKMDSLKQFVDKKITKKELAMLINKEKKSYLKNKKKVPIWNLQKNIKISKANNKNMLNGLAGSPGKTEGKVYIINSTEDFSKFPKNSVLVARTTNPAWTPLFYNACAVITESGGPLSHGAVTAREMKLPAVMSVQNVLKILKNGQKVVVDGNNGIVYIKK